jgi:hypothetical protein
LPLILRQKAEHLTATRRELGATTLRAAGLPRVNARWIVELQLAPAALIDPITELTKARVHVRVYLRKSWTSTIADDNSSKARDG